MKSFIFQLALAACLTNFSQLAFAADGSPLEPGPSTGVQKGGGSDTNAVSPVSHPAIIYVADFQLDPSQIQETSGGSGPLGGRIGARRTEDPATRARNVVRTLSDSIIRRLRNEGLRAEALPGVSANYMPDQADGKLQFVAGKQALPTEGWLVTGWFENVEEGNAAVQATVGLGKGAGQATADVAVSDLSRDPALVFLVMGSGSRAKKMPGGLVTMNPYVMAAKFVMTKRQGVDKDVNSLGTEIAKSLIDYIQHAPTQGPATSSNP